MAARKSMLERSSMLLVAPLLLLASQSWAKTSDISPSAFLASFHEEVDATPEQSWQALVRVAGWWSAAHTYSGDAANLTLDARAGGCWCERWGANSVQHARVLVAMPGKLLRLEGALGPFQALGATGILTFTLLPHGSGTSLDVTYRVRATPDAAMDKLAPAVDQVLGEQVRRLAGSLVKQDGEKPSLK
ncbi:MAG TPA: SRPBCC domain-containing protein [Usitatibacter sp.]|jgi:hypothetical protein|nr:SRPBCC domain-containing protein [Usitatibacter sp.]